MQRFAISTWLLAALTLLGVSAAVAEDFIRVEIRGTLNSGIMAIGGETTGTTVSAGEIVWELEISPNSDLAERLAALNGAEVVVTGSYREMRGVEVPLRYIVTVDSIRLPLD